jgi:hypothetical protein
LSDCSTLELDLHSPKPGQSSGIVAGHHDHAPLRRNAVMWQHSTVSWTD